MKDTLPQNDSHIRPEGASDKTVEAAGKLSEAMETIEQARGHLYAFHQLSGGADLAVGKAVDLLREAGHNDLASMVDERLVGLNTLPGRWTFQIVEEYDDEYYATAKQVEKDVRDKLMNGKRHVFESEMKERRRSHGKPGHEARP